MESNLWFEKLDTSSEQCHIYTHIYNIYMHIYIYIYIYIYVYILLLFQVVIPGLHLSLGIYLKFYNLMQGDCRNLDLQIICKENLNTSNTYINSCKTLKKYRKKSRNLLMNCRSWTMQFSQKYNLLPVMKTKYNHNTRIG